MSEVVSVPKFVALVEKHFADHTTSEIERILNRSSGYWAKLKRYRYLRLNTVDGYLTDLNLTHVLYTGELEIEDVKLHGCRSDKGHYSGGRTSSERVVALMREARTKMGATEIAQHCGVSLTVVKRMLRGDRSCTRQTEAKVLAALLPEGRCDTLPLPRSPNVRSPERDAPN